MFQRPLRVISERVSRRTSEWVRAVRAPNVSEEIIGDPDSRVCDEHVVLRWLQWFDFSGGR